jgi:PAS domain-containing protein
MGVKGFLLKPVAIGDIGEMVRNVLDEAAGSSTLSAIRPAVDIDFQKREKRPGVLMNNSIPTNGIDRSAESLTFLQNLTDAIPISLFHTDRDGRFKFCNPAFAELFGLDPLYIIGKTLADLVSSVIENDQNK